MMKRLSIVFAILICLTVVIACVTVNIYFPAAEIQRAAEEIVEEARPEQQEKEGGSLKPIRHRWLATMLRILRPGIAFAQVDINISTPAIRNLRASLTSRFGSLKGFYSRGSLGENKRGYVEIRDESGLGLKEKGDLRRLAGAENADRKALYLEILRANNLDTQFLSEVEKIFANNWKSKAVPGSWIQSDDDKWRRK